MVDVAPFQAIRYDKTRRSQDLSEFLSPPYDVISPEAREKLVQKSPFNIVQLELPTGDAQQKYANAARLFQDWQKKGVLIEDKNPAFYLLETAFRLKDPFAPPRRLKRYGVLVALKTEMPGKGAIHPHEKTLPKAKEDRLDLLRALRMNVSPIFGLFFDPKKEWKKWLAKTVKTKPPIVHGRETKDLDHRLWRVDQPVLLKQLRDFLKKKDIYIADGHHRYEVSWAYKGQRLQENPGADLTSGWHRVMAYLCPMEETGLLMLPTHRLVKSVKSNEEWRTHLEIFFEVEPVKTRAALVKTVNALHSGQRVIGWITSQGCFLLRLRKDLQIDLCLNHRAPALRGLGAVLLHDLALGEAPGMGFLRDKEIIYTRDLDEIDTRVKEKNGWVAFLLSSPDLAFLARVASSHEVMPPKTTYFYPKVPTGFALMPLERKII